MALIGLVLIKAADYLVEKQKSLPVKALHMHQRIGQFEILKKIEKNWVKFKFVTALILLVVLILAGTIFLSEVENLSLVDAFYCVCSTFTPLEYGELTIENRQKLLAKWILIQSMTNADLEAADLDNDGVGGVAEFVLFKLKDMGKIREEDISVLKEKFEELDLDQSSIKLRER
ncbi:hypothetical protein PTKIN_Ptkin11bG0119800 [Pterospermum kingtungense]